MLEVENCREEVKFVYEILRQREKQMQVLTEKVEVMSGLHFIKKNSNFESHYLEDTSGQVIEQYEK